MNATRRSVPFPRRGLTASAPLRLRRGSAKPRGDAVADAARGTVRDAAQTRARPVIVPPEVPLVPPLAANPLAFTYAVIQRRRPRAVAGAVAERFGLGWWRAASSDQPHRRPGAWARADHRQTLLRTPGMQQGGVHLVPLPVPGPAVPRMPRRPTSCQASTSRRARSNSLRRTGAAGYSSARRSASSSPTRSSCTRCTCPSRRRQLRVRRAGRASRSQSAQGLWRDAADGRGSHDNKLEGVLRGRMMGLKDLVQPLQRAGGRRPSACRRGAASTSASSATRPTTMAGSRSCSTKARRAPTCIRVRSRQRAACCPVTCFVPDVGAILADRRRRAADARRAGRPMASSPRSSARRGWRRWW